MNAAASRGLVLRKLWKGRGMTGLATEFVLTATLVSSFWSADQRCLCTTHTFTFLHTFTVFRWFRNVVIGKPYSDTTFVGQLSEALQLVPNHWK